ncbi:MAG TPA: TIGR01777 family oxidoreductase [Solirubrobacterales bacterium]|nr:TIGR01777 family oxidoreductase [Solirubrobacterales bacterium]
MKVLLSGASGFIGRALCDALLIRSEEVVGLTRNPERARDTDPRVAWHAWEPTLERPPAAAFSGVDGVINLLGEKINQRWTETAKRRIMASRRSGTHNLVAAIASLEHKPAVLVSQSAIGYYGNRGATIVDESSAAGDGFAAEVTEEWEKAAREIESVGLRLVVVRTGHVLDSGGGMLAQLLRPFRFGVGGPIAGGGQYMSWIHIEDEVGILLWALEDKRVSGVLNATAPNPVTNRELSEALGRALGRPAVIPVPGLALDLIFGREFAAVLKGGQRALPRRALDLGYEFQHPDLEEALADLL